MKTWVFALIVFIVFGAMFIGLLVLINDTNNNNTEIKSTVSMNSCINNNGLYISNETGAFCDFKNGTTIKIKK